MQSVGPHGYFDYLHQSLLACVDHEIYRLGINSAYLLQYNHIILLPIIAALAPITSPPCEARADC
jgi:hypothetical protein